MFVIQDKTTGKVFNGWKGYRATIAEWCIPEDMFQVCVYRERADAQDVIDSLDDSLHCPYRIVPLSELA